LFRISSLAGEIADEVVAGVKEKPIRNAEYFTEVSPVGGPGGLTLRGKEAANVLTVGTGNITFTQDRYSSRVDIDKFLEEFGQLWKIIDHVVSIQQVRRIGIVAEHRVTGISDPSKFLAEKFTRFPASDIAAKFIFGIERRIPLSQATKVNIATDAFTNVITQVYDAELDTQRPEDNAFNINLDVQRYFGGQKHESVVRELPSIRKDFETRWKELQTQVVAMGLIS
jgi:hypothetical protein